MTQLIVEGFATYGLGTASPASRLDISQAMKSGAWADVVHGHLGGRPPAVDLEAERVLGEILVAGSRDGMISAAHDVSEGGLVQTLVEMCISGESGARIVLPTDDVIRRGTGAYHAARRRPPGT